MRLGRRRGTRDRAARDTGIAIARAEGVTASRVGRPPTGSCSTLAGLDSISVADDGLATIGAGACLARVYAAVHVHGRTIPAGCGATVGIAGLTLGGGIGLLGRKHGLTCDRLVGARVVLADGRIVDCDADREPELFWALRGAGGGQFGVVTSLDDWATAYHAGNHPRPAAAKKAYDPDRLFEFPQSI